MDFFGAAHRWGTTADISIFPSKLAIFVMLGSTEQNCILIQLFLILLTFRVLRDCFNQDDCSFDFIKIDYCRPP